MNKRARLFYIIIIFLILDTLIAQIKVIPSWKNVQTVFIVSVFIGTLVTGLLYLFKLWNTRYKEKPNIMQRLITTSILIVAFPLVWLMAIPIFDKPKLVNEVRLGSKTIYVYYEYCFPPDNECECDTYGSFIYTKINIYPLCISY